MYYQHFRLKGPPFQPASPDSAVYFSPTHLQGLATLESGLSQELTGFTLLTGEAGTGKTTLIYSLLQRDYKRARIAHIDDPKLSFLEIMQVILTQLNLYSTGSTKLEYLEALDRFLQTHGKEERIAIVVDEAQVLSDDVLEELRLLSNHVQSHDRRLQLILVGHPELAARLRKPELRQLNQRISSRGVLKPLSTEQAIKYVECKLSAQGGKSSAIFARGALKCLLRRSDGLPRKINMLCHTAMLTAYNGLEKKVSYKTARKIAAEYHDSVRIQKERGALLPAFVVGAAFASLLLVGFVYSNVWSKWVSGRPNERTAQSVEPVKQVKTVESPQAVEQAKPVEQSKPVEPAQTVEPAKVVAPNKTVEQVNAVAQVKPVEQPGVVAHSDASAKSNTTVPAAPRPELRASLAPVATAPTTPKNIAPSATAPETRLDPTAPAAAAVIPAPQKQATVPAASERRSQISVKSGDTLEKIAIGYLGSKTGINELIAVNPQLTNINQLSVGQIINLPPGISPKASRDQDATERAAPSAQDPSEQ